MTILISLKKPIQDDATTEFNIVAEHSIGSNNAHISDERYQDYLFSISFLSFVLSLQLDWQFNRESGTLSR